MTDSLAIATIQQPAVPTPEKVESIKEICRVAAVSGLLQSNSKDVGQRMADSFFVAMYGYELGIAPITALQQIYVINGKPSCSGQLMLSLVRRAGFVVDMPDPATITDKATVGIQRPGGKMKQYTYTNDMAKQAGLLGKGMWAKYPREMLMWRAVSTACRMEAGDVIGGLYTVEEISPDTPVDHDGAPLVIAAKVSQLEPETSATKGESAQTTPPPAPKQPAPNTNNPYTRANAAAKAAAEQPATSDTGSEAPGAGEPDWMSNQAIGVVTMQVVNTLKGMDDFNPAHIQNYIKKARKEGAYNACETLADAVRITLEHFNTDDPGNGGFTPEPAPENMSEIPF